MQSVKESIAESLTNTFVGFILAFVTNGVLMLAVGVSASASQNAAIVIGHTVVSIVRNFVIRRVFTNRLWLLWRTK